MTDCLCVKGFNEITYDELMDVVGGGVYAKGEINSDGGSFIEVGYTSGNDTWFAGYSQERGFYHGHSTRSA